MQHGMANVNAAWAYVLKFLFELEKTFFYLLFDWRWELLIVADQFGVFGVIVDWSHWLTAIRSWALGLLKGIRILEFWLFAVLLF